MRTTVTLDSDVERLIRDAMRERAVSFKEALNEAARIGLSGKRPKRTAKFAQKSFRMGETQEFRWDKALAVADAIEDEELSRKIALRKMILLDANLLIYAVNADAPLNRKAKSWLESVLSGREAVGFPWNVLLAFPRLTTRPGLFRRPLPVDKAFDLVACWLDQPAATIVHPGPRHLQILRELLLAMGTGGNLASDAHLAALAIEHRAELCSSDTDFARFNGLKWRNPLA